MSLLSMLAAGAAAAAVVDAAASALAAAVVAVLLDEDPPQAARLAIMAADVIPATSFLKIFLISILLCYLEASFCLFFMTSTEI